MFKKNTPQESRIANSKKLPRLTVFLGAGGVGKTTLSAGYAVALAEQGLKVGLMSIDPAKRLKSALGVEELPELGCVIQLATSNDSHADKKNENKSDKKKDSDNNKKSEGQLIAALLLVGDSLKRWVKAEGLSQASEQRLLLNPLFRAITDKLATATDTFAAVRMAEWVELHPELDELIIDTAPGIHAIDFLSKPEKLISFLDSKLVEWLKWFVGGQEQKSGLWQKVVKVGARKVLDGLAQIGGQGFLINFGEFLILLDDVFLTMLKRLETARSWLRNSDTRFVLVSSVREDTAKVALELGESLKALHMKARVAVINRSFPEDLANDAGLAQILSSQTSGEATFFVNALKANIQTEAYVKNQLGPLSEELVCLPLMADLDGVQNLRLADLGSLGRHLIARSEKLKA